MKLASYCRFSLRKFAFIRGDPAIKLRRDAFQALNVKQFTEHELNQTFMEISHGEEKISNGQFLDNLQQMIRRKDIPAVERQVENVATCLSLKEKSDALTMGQFRQKVITLGEKIDRSVVVPMALSFLLSGASIGIVIPCMPLLIQQLSITPSEFGMVVGTFGLAKLVGNIPTAFYVEKYGRKPVIVTGLTLCALGIGGVGATLCPGMAGWALPWLLGCRFLTGIGVSAFSSGAYMMISDVSTALNRARTISPVHAAFQSGISLGPAAGGISIDEIGIQATYGICGTMLASTAVLNHMILKETIPNSSPGRKDQVVRYEQSKQQQQRQPTVKKGGFHSFVEAGRIWKVLLQSVPLRDICLLNFSYWIALAGVQMTVLPIFLVGDPFHLGATDIGWCFAAMSLVSVGASQPIAIVADRYGKVPTILAAMGIISASMLTLPHAADFPELLGVLVALSLGSTAIQNLPIAYLGDLTSEESRSQALSLFRTVGDIGLLAGAAIAGTIAQYTTLIDAINVNGTLVLGTLGILGFRHYRRMQFARKSKQAS